MASAPDLASQQVSERRLPPDQAATHFGEVIQGYDPSAATAEAQRGLGISYGRATAACPFGVDLDAVVHSVAAGDFDHAASVVREAHPWGSIMGRCCHKFCEAAMAQAYPPGIAPLNLRGLERAASDHGRWAPVTSHVAPSGRRVAVVGAGSGGLGAALGLVRRGHEVTIYDALPTIGGMFVVGYPNFRMPREVLRRELPIESPHLHLALNQRVDAARLRDLLDTFDAVCLATGKFQPADVRLPGDDLEGVYEALDFLEKVSFGAPPPIGNEVAVLGAGYTAQDAARTARRLGAKVHVLYRRTAEEMPISPSHRQPFLRMMEREGVPYQFLMSPVRILGEHGRATAVECQHMRLAEPDASARRQAVPSDEPLLVLPVTAVIKAFGQRPELSILPDDVRTDGPFVVNVQQRSTREGLFVIGDIAGNVGNDGAFVGGLETSSEIDLYFASGCSDWPTIDEGLRMRVRRPGVSAAGD